MIWNFMLFVFAVVLFLLGGIYGVFSPVVAIPCGIVSAGAALTSYYEIK